MPKGGTVTFEVQPFAVIEAVDWLLSYDPFGAHAALPLSNFAAGSHAEGQAAWQMRVADACRPLVKWLKRGKRYERPFQKTPLCLDREIARWLGNYAPARNGGLFGNSSRKSPSHKAPKSAAALYFFSACRSATTRRMGRPRLSRREIDERANDTAKLANTTAWRMVKLSEQRLPNIEGLLEAYFQKTP